MLEVANLQMNVNLLYCLMLDCALTEFDSK